MSKPWIHAESSARKFGGKPEDYIEIHNLLDSSKATICDNRHRALTHHSWFLSVILERIFGVTLKNSDGKTVSVRDVGEQHVSEDFGGKYIPSAQDYLAEIELKDWMCNGKGAPPASFKKIAENYIPQKRKEAKVEKVTIDELESPGVSTLVVDGSQRTESSLPDFVVDGSRNEFPNIRYD